MVVARKKMLVWPPVDESTYGGWPASYAYLSWFVGHLAEEICLPVVSSLRGETLMPSYVSAAALHDSERIRLIPVSSAERSEPLFGDVDIVLLRKCDVTHCPPQIPLRRMLGSEPVQGIIETKDQASPCYYFIGDSEVDKQDAYYAVCFTYWFLGGEDKHFLEKSRLKLMELQKSAKNESRISVFGTGPSVVEALEGNHLSNFNIICNTIVKNRKFLERLRPRIVVASDAHFHFSFHRYSARFLSDLLFLLDRYDASFFTFDKFASFVKLRVPELSDKIFGIPAGRKTYGFDLDNDYRIFPGESVLNMFLLPIASFLGDEISLYGFTGRAPNDSYFWGHSELHQYADLMEDVRLAHPAFFCNRDYPGYADVVDRNITERVSVAASAGKNIKSETTSFYTSFSS